LSGRAGHSTAVYIGAGHGEPRGSPGCRSERGAARTLTLRPETDVAVAATRAVSVRTWLIAVVVVGVVLGVAYLAQAGRSRVIFDGESEFGRVRVVERGDGLRSLHTGAFRATQTSLYPERPLFLVAPYTRVALIGPALAPRDGRLLFVGLGGGAMPTYTRKVMSEATIDVVEIDPMIIDVAKSYFGFVADERLSVHADDGRAFIERAPAGSWDVIVLDAFSDDEVPYALTTAEFLAAVRARLTGDGVVVSNLWTANERYASMVETYRAVFDQVALIRVERRPQVILVAAHAERPLDRDALVSAAQSFMQHVGSDFDLSALVAEGYDTLPGRGAPVLHGERSGS
jgi:spermidine synthase